MTDDEIIEAAAERARMKETAGCELTDFMPGMMESFNRTFLRPFPQNPRTLTDKGMDI